MQENGGVSQIARITPYLPDELTEVEGGSQFNCPLHSSCRAYLTNEGELGCDTLDEAHADAHRMHYELAKALGVPLDYTEMPQERISHETLEDLWRREREASERANGARTHSENLSTTKIAYPNGSGRDPARFAAEAQQALTPGSPAAPIKVPALSAVKPTKEKSPQPNLATEAISGGEASVDAVTKVTSSGAGTQGEPEEKSRHRLSPSQGAGAQPDSRKRLDRNPQTPLRDTALEAIAQRVPPQDIEAEKALLGAVFLDNSVMPEMRRVVRPVDFYRESHREIYKAMLRAADAGNEIDAVTLRHELGKDKLEAVGGGSYLAELAAAPPWVKNFARYAEIVREVAIKRDVINGAHELMEHAFNGTGLPELQTYVERLRVEQAGGSQLPQLITRDIEILSGREFARRQRSVVRHWLIEGLLVRKEISLWSGKVEHGKTTLIRTLVMCVLRGELFLGRHVYPGRVLYVMLDADGEALTYELFDKLGMDWENDAIDLLVDPVMCLRPNSFQQFHARLLEYKPDLVVIDPLGRFKKIEEKDGGFSGYGMTYAMAEFSELAKQADCHILLLHHIPRGRADNDDPATAGFGSVAIAGGCNARFSCIKQPGGVFTLVTSKGKGGGFVPFDTVQRLNKDPDTEWVSLAGEYSWKDQADAVKPEILRMVLTSEEWLSAAELAHALGCQRSIAGTAAKSLYKKGEIDMIVTRGNKHFFGRFGLDKEAVHKQR